jgi:hypothetical protein
MKKLSIKQLIIIFVAGLVLVTGAQVAVMTTSDFEGGRMRGSREECMVDREFSDMDIDEMMEMRDSMGNRRNSGKSGHR